MGTRNKKDIGAVLHKDGVAFRVWAPFAEAVAVTGSFNNWAKAPMASEGDGYWFVDIKGARAGEEYKFVIKSGDRELFRNDPRSLQLTTDAGNSVIVDPKFHWGDDTFIPAPVNQRVIYEMHVGTFNREDAATQGTFQTAIQKLDYLTELGINTIEIMPIGSMYKDRGWGYASDYIYAVESLYGGRHEFLEFVKAAHHKNIAVILDVVYNHFGPDTSIDLWQFDGWSQDGKGGIYFYNDWRRATPWGDTRPDYGRDEVRQYITDNVRMWLADCQVDGLRVDSTIFIRNVKGNNNDPGNDLPDGWRMLQEVTAMTKKVSPSALAIGEDTSGNEYITKPVNEGGAGFSAQWEVGFPQLMRDMLVAVNDADRNLETLRAALTQNYNGDCFQRVIYSDSHDSAANGGARLNELISPGNAGSVFARRRSLVAAALVLTSPGIPMIFQGQEFLEDGPFNDWDGLNWDKAEQFAGIALAYKHMIALRRNMYGNTAGLTGRAVNVLHLNNNAKVMAYHRWDAGGPGDDVVVVVNFANKVQENYKVGFPREGKWTVRFNSDWDGYSPDFKNTTTSEVQVDGGTGAVNLGPYAILILSQNKSGND
jgi:1,4-alpha-glucan branching enzyme